MFEDLIKRIEKNVKGIHCSVMADSDIAENTDWVSTPSMDLNRALSGDLNRGIPSKSMVVIAGPEHTFKSSFVVLSMVDAQKQGFTPVIIDTERGITKDFAARWGLDISKCLYIYTPWVDEVSTIIAQLKESGEQKYIIGLDSIGGLDNYKIVTDAVDGDPKMDQGLLQKRIKTLLKLILNVCVTQNSIAIMSAHMYATPNGPMKINGGNAVRLLPNILIELRRELRKDKEKRSAGNDIKAITLKNRVYPAFQEALIDIDFINGVNKYGGLVDLLMKAEIVKGGGGRYKIISSDKELGHGLDAATANLEKYPELLEELSAWIKSTGYSSINATVKDLVEKGQIESSMDINETPFGVEELTAANKTETKTKKTVKK